MTASREALREEFKELEARRDYAEFFGNSSIALQLKALRLQRGWSQGELGKRAGMKQSRISAMEQANYSRWSIRTLRRLAEAFDLALVVRLESFGTLLRDVTSASRSRLERPSFADDPEFAEPKAALATDGWAHVLSTAYDHVTSAPISIEPSASLTFSVLEPEWFRPHLLTLPSSEALGVLYAEENYATTA